MTIDPVQNQDKMVAEQPAQQKSDKDLNFERLRNRAEAAERAAQEAKARIAQLEREREALNTRPVEEEDEERSDEPYVDERRLAKKLTKFEAKWKKESESLIEQKARALMEQEKQRQFLQANPDFADILQPETIQRFAMEHPDLAEPLAEMPDGFARQKLLYTQIKKLAAQKKAAEKPAIQETIDKNQRSPYYVSPSGGTPPYAQTGDFSEAGQKNAWQKMQQMIKNRRGL